MSDGEVCLLDKLPDEVLEFILCNVSQYLDLQNCALVCKRWQERVRGLHHIENDLFDGSDNSYLGFSCEEEDQVQFPPGNCRLQHSMD